MDNNKPANDMEAWLSGPVADVPGLLQPVAHALIQANREIQKVMTGFPEEYLWECPSGLASVGFHLQHIRGVLDRLFTYADNRQLSASQLDHLSKEGKEDGNLTVRMLLDDLNNQVEASLGYLRKTNPQMLLNTRGVGRKLVPSTLIGLLFHAAEHTMRHTGQLLVTAKIVMSK